MKTGSVLLAVSSLFLLAPRAAAWLKVGNRAPEVTGITDTGARLDFAALYKQGNTLVYFFPQAGSPDGTAQSCSLRDSFAELSKLGVNVVGVSHDSPAVQQNFKAQNKLPFILIADEDKAVSKAFAVPEIRGTNFLKRQAFLINQAGVVVWCDYKASAENQGKEVLKAVARLTSGRGRTPLDKDMTEAVKNQDNRTAVTMERARDAEPYAGKPQTQPTGR